MAKQNEEIGILLDALNHSRKKLEEAQSQNQKLEMLVGSLRAELASVSGSSPNEGYY
jgi:hypothetical protein